MRYEHARKIRANLIGMYAARDEHNGLAALYQISGLCIRVRAKLSRVCEHLLNLSILIESRKILRRANSSHHKRRAHSSFAQLLELHTVARRIQFSKI